VRWRSVDLALAERDSARVTRLAETECVNDVMIIVDQLGDASERIVDRGVVAVELEHTALDPVSRAGEEESDTFPYVVVGDVIRDNAQAHGYLQLIGR
jgi:hypothetical protein